MKTMFQVQRSAMWNGYRYDWTDGTGYARRNRAYPDAPFDTIEDARKEIQRAKRLDKKSLYETARQYRIVKISREVVE